MPTVRVKICGVTRPEDAVAAEEAGADSIGLMFVPESRRFIDLERAHEIRRAVGPLIVTVGVFRDAPLRQVVDTASRLQLGAVQLHGQEDSRYIETVRQSVPVIRALSFGSHLDRKQLEAEPADALLLDGLRPGSGEAFEWAQALEFRALPRLILAGGLRPENVAEGVRSLKPYGVDVSSGVEASPGIKDHGRIIAFVNAARSAAPDSSM